MPTAENVDNVNISSPESFGSEVQYLMSNRHELELGKVMSMSCASTFENFDIALSLLSVWSRTFVFMIHQARKSISALTIFLTVVRSQYVGDVSQKKISDSKLSKEEALVLPTIQDYKYGYHIKDDGIGEQFHRESSDGDGKVTGTFGYTDHQGLYRIVDYVADKGGFIAKIKTNEPGISSKNPADLEILKEPSPSITSQKTSSGSKPKSQPKFTAPAPVKDKTKQKSETVSLAKSKPKSTLKPNPVKHISVPISILPKYPFSKRIHGVHHFPTKDPIVKYISPSPYSVVRTAFPPTFYPDRTVLALPKHGLAPYPPIYTPPVPKPAPYYPIHTPTKLRSATYHPRKTARIPSILKLSPHPPVKFISIKPKARFIPVHPPYAPKTPQNHVILPYPPIKINSVPSHHKHTPYRSVRLPKLAPKPLIKTISLPSHYKHAPYPPAQLPKLPPKHLVKIISVPSHYEHVPYPPARLPKLPPKHLVKIISVPSHYEHVPYPPARLPKLPPKPLIKTISLPSHYKHVPYPPARLPKLPPKHLVKIISVPSHYEHVPYPPARLPKLPPKPLVKVTSLPSRSKRIIYSPAYHHVA
ncbi:uncharacterized protein LOC143223882 [Tachypleus tridentatus]|uniref:uncharacterized protein LOC143223882 n=1 Tax=Tachypleus tridentatus TaxID=6853 RepID=UPI003FD5F5B8